MSSSGEEQKTPLEGSQGSGQKKQNKNSTKDSGTFEEDKYSGKDYSSFTQTESGDYKSLATEELDGFDNIRRLDGLKIKDQNTESGILSAGKPEENMSQFKEENVATLKETQKLIAQSYSLKRESLMSKSKIKLGGAQGAAPTQSY